MNQHKALDATIKLAYQERGKLPTRGPFSYEHYLDMYKRAVRDGYSEGKLGRHLGWMQAGLAYSLSFGDPASAEKWLEHMKKINQSCA